MKQKKENRVALLLHWAGEQKIWLFLAIFLSAVSGLCIIVPYIGIYRLMDATFNHTCTQELVVHTVVMIAVAVTLRFALFGCSGVAAHKGAYGALFKVRCMVAEHTRKRIGRGPGSGLGGTSTRGHKGAKSRSGYKNKIGFEGGQMPIQRRLPKFGFKNINRVEYKAINIDTLQQMAEAKQLTKIGINELMEAGFISSSQVVKILGNGSLTAKLEVEAHAFSKSAEAAIQAAGGTVVKL